MFYTLKLFPLMFCCLWFYTSTWDVFFCLGFYLYIYFFYIFLPNLDKQTIASEMWIDIVLKLLGWILTWFSLGFIATETQVWIWTSFVQKVALILWLRSDSSCYIFPSFGLFCVYLSRNCWPTLTVSDRLPLSSFNNFLVCQ